MNILTIQKIAKEIEVLTINFKVHQISYAVANERVCIEALRYHHAHNALSPSYLRNLKSQHGDNCPYPVVPHFPH